MTLKLVARYADACNLGGTVENIREADAVLVAHCESIGRDEREIERTLGIGVPMIRDSREEAERARTAIFTTNGNATPWADQPVGTPEDVLEMLAPYVEMGYRHIICGFPAPYDVETMTRLATEVRPRLEAMVTSR